MNNIRLKYDTNQNNIESIESWARMQVHGNAGLKLGKQEWNYVRNICDGMTKNLYVGAIYMVMKYQEYWMQEWNIYVQWFLWEIGEALWETLHTLSDEFYVLDNWVMCSLFI